MCLLIIILSIYLLYPDVSSGKCFTLDGKHKFSSGDNSLWTEKNFDDSNWLTINVPGSWNSQGINVGKIGWYRIHFKLPKDFKVSEPAIYLGLVGNADEVFVNGVKIGGEGKIDQNFVLPPDNLYRIYRIPIDVLDFNGENVLSVRVLNLLFEGGIIGPSIIFGDFGTLSLKVVKKEVTIKALEIAMLLFFGAFLIGSLLLYFKGVKESIYFSLLLIVYCGIFLTDSFMFYRWGLKSPLIQKWNFSLVGLFPAVFFLFLTKYLKKHITVFYRITFIFFSLLSILVFLFLSLNTYSYFLAIWSIVLPIYVVAVLYILWKSYRTGRSEVKFILSGFLIFAILSLLDEVSAISRHKFIFSFLSLHPSDYGMAIMLAFIMYGMIVGFVNVRDRMRLLSSKILVAHEEERKYLARELHDGLGQNLLAIKFNLQKFNMKFKAPELRCIIDEIDRSIEELREISKGLRPAMLSEMGIGTALKLFCKNFTLKTNIKVSVDIDIPNRPSQKIEENLFRIFQEALNNVVKHSQATEVNVSLVWKHSCFIMQIKDNGVGFNLKDAKNGGIGLSTMAERAELLGGTFKIETYKGKGTTITVEVPE